MNDVFSAEDASAIARDITIDLSEAVAGTSLECEQGGVYQSTPWSTASVHIRRQIEGDKLTIETVFDTQLAINTGSGGQPGAYRITSRGTVFFNEPILVNNNFVQQRTECSLEGDTCYANRPACLADAFGAANDQGVIGNPNTEYERLNFFGIDPQCWEPAGFSRVAAPWLMRGLPKIYSAARCRTRSIACLTMKDLLSAKIVKQASTLKLAGPVSITI